MHLALFHFLIYSFILVRVFLLIIFLSVAFPALAIYRFPEESFRPLWDRGCEDWPLNVQKEMQGLPKNPDVRVEKTGGVFRILAKMRISPERGESSAELLKSVELLMSNGFRYPKWVLPSINEKPGGGRYFVTLDSLDVKEIYHGENKEENRTFALSGPYTFHLLWFQKSGKSSLEFKKENVQPPLECELFQKLKLRTEARIPKFTYRMTPREDILKWLLAEIYMVNTGAYVEVYFRLVGKPAPLLYELMPEQMLRAELEARGTRVFENFVEFRRFLYLDEMRSSLKKTPLKEAAPSKSVR